MTTSSVPSVHLRPVRPGNPDRAGAGRRTYWPAIAGVAYLLAWTVGLAVWPANLALNATAGQVAATHLAHPAEAAAQYLLVEGLAGVLVGVVLGNAVGARRGRRTGGAGHRGRISARAGSATAIAAATVAVVTVAVVTSLTQCILGLLVIAAATGHDIIRSGDLFALVNRLDGVKMLALAGTAALIAPIRGTAPVLPRWLRVVTVPLVVALIVSACAYLTLSQSLAWTAFASGPLLLLWVTGTGLALTVRHRAATRI